MVTMGPVCLMKLTRKRKLIRTHSLVERNLIGSLIFWTFSKIQKMWATSCQCPSTANNIGAPEVMADWAKMLSFCLCISQFFSMDYGFPQAVHLAPEEKPAQMAQESLRKTD